MPGAGCAGGGVATDGVAFSEPFLFDLPKGESGTVFFSGGASGFFVSTTGGAGFSIFATGSAGFAVGAPARAGATGARRSSIVRGVCTTGWCSAAQIASAERPPCSSSDSATSAPAPPLSALRCASTSPTRSSTRHHPRLRHHAELLHPRAVHHVEHRHHLPV